jgi:hypothetical protein
MLAFAVALIAILFLASRASAFNYVYNTNQDYWGVNDAATPGLDTGSIQSTATKSLQGYGGIRMQVNGAPKTPLLNGVLMRGFGLTFDGSNSFSSTHAVSLGGVAVTRSLVVNQEKTTPASSTPSPTRDVRRSASTSTSAVSSGTTSPPARPAATRVRPSPPPAVTPR